MAEEFDVFAGAMKHGNGANGAGQPAPGNAGKKKYFRKSYNRGGKANNSPLRGANGEAAGVPRLCTPEV